ncbi:MAG: 4'-phosphopantetheinyl transferase superfamily protein [Prevotellaceae bacterium]|nr:4'-phosphopantetheinyl transferase superfamily protein [Prevotellaceae bacterium]
MPLLLKHSEGNTRWGIWKIEESPQALLGMLGDGEAHVEALTQLKTEARRQEWLAVRVLLQQLAGPGKRIVYLPSGKPMLADNAYAISVSHTKGYAALLLKAAGSEAGIDIERYGHRVRRVASKFMNEAEQAAPYQGDDTWSLLLHWSAKETIYKCIGSAVVDFRHTLHIAPFVPAEEGVMQATALLEGEATGKPYHIRYRLFPHFVLTMNV